MYIAPEWYPVGNMAKLRSLNMKDFGVLAWAAVVLPLTAVRLKFLGLGKTHDWAMGIDPAEPQSEIDSLAKSQHLARLINAVAMRGFYRANCLCRSLVLLRAMRRRKLGGELKVGVANEGGNSHFSTFNAHAWVESHNVIINDSKDVASRYSSFDRERPEKSCHFR